MKTVKLVKGWNGNSPGTVLNLEPDDCATQLVARGLAEYVEASDSGKAKPKVKLQSWVKKPGGDSNEQD